MSSAKLNYLIRSAARSPFADTTCPSCHSGGTRLVRRKYLVTSLRECPTCKLRFRVPKDQVEAVSKFYVEEEYSQGFTTDLPSDEELTGLLANRFAGTEKDFAPRVAALKAAGLEDGARILDFGSSWGYGSRQLSDAGFEVYSYEIGRDRARYAREKLGCRMVDDLRILDGTVDCFFSSHVIEHLPDPTLPFSEARQLLKAGWLFVCFCPNGSPDREGLPGYHQAWGLVHPMLITPAFLAKSAEDHGFVDPQLFSLDGDGIARTSMTEGELLMTARFTRPC